MAEILESRESRPNRSSFLTSDNWTYRRRRALRQSGRIVASPTMPPASRKKETAKPTQGVVGFLQWMRRLMDKLEQQRQARQNQSLARIALKRITRK